MTNSLKVTLHIRRTTGWQDVAVEVQPDAFVLDALEAAYINDPGLLFRHACHHASCGSCGLRVNSREKLACITRLTEVIQPGKPLRIEPLRNFPILGDLLVDFGPVMRRLDLIDLPPVREAETLIWADPLYNSSHVARILSPSPDFPSLVEKTLANPNRLENCIECGLCISACPVVGTDQEYLGPAVLAAAGRLAAEPRGHSLVEMLGLVDGEHGLWRCHGAFECTEVCPAEVDPARNIMSLRSNLLRGTSMNNLTPEENNEDL